MSENAIFGGKRILLIKEYGELGNRLMTFSHLAALAASRGYMVHNFSFSRYAHYFSNFQGKLVATLPVEDTLGRWLGNKDTPLRLALLLRLFRNKNFQAYLKRSGRIVEADNLDELGEDHVALNALNGARKIVFWTAWNLHFHELRKQWRNSIVSWFRPTENISAFIDSEFAMVPKDCLPVGIHVRRGDYEHYQGGRYFFQHDYYRRVTSHIAAQARGAKLHFLITSNAPVPESITTGHSCTVLHGNEAEDMFALSRCKLIAGPPSTFSEWAAYFGGATLIKLDGEMPALGPM